MKNPIYLTFILVVINLIELSNCQTDNKIATTIQKLRNQLRDRIYPENSQVHEFIKDDLYILRWLQQNNFNPTQAFNAILDHLKWRDRENIDKIDSEDWSRMREEFPQFVNGTDRSGRPLAEMWLSEWDIRRAYVGGQGRKLVRWTTHLFEMAQQALYRTRRENRNEKVTGVTEIVDMDGFNSWKHACVPCTAFFVSLGHLSNDMYPHLFDRNHMVNVGPLFRQFLNVMVRNFGYKSKDALKLYSSRREWLPALEREIDESQRSTRFGGTVNRS